MKLKHVLWITYGLAALAFLSCCLMIAHIAFSLLAIILVIAIGIFNWAYFRCPACEKHLGRTYGKYCPFCAKELDLS